MAYPPGDESGRAASQPKENESKDSTRVLRSDSGSYDSFVSCDDIDMDSEPETSAMESPLRNLGLDPSTSPSADAFSAFDVPPDNGLASNSAVPIPGKAVSESVPSSSRESAGDTRQNSYLTKRDDDSVRIFKDYELLEEIGRGGMGIVFKARQRSLNRMVALKMIISGELASEIAIHRFYREAQSAAGLDHPNIVPIYEIGEHEGKHFFSMAFVEGTSLADRAKSEPFTAIEAAQMVKTVAEAVQYAHDRGIIHRDLKPANILLDRQGRPRITDFGLAKQVGEDSNLTASGNILGTPSYMSPEQATGDAASMGPGTDIYSLGGILFRLLTGKPPFQGKSLTETLVAVLHQPPVPARSIKADVPAELEAICLKCLQKDRKQRYASAGRFAAALGEWLRQQGQDGGNGTLVDSHLLDDPVPEESLSHGSKSGIFRNRRARIAALAMACGIMAFAATMFVRNFAADRSTGSDIGTPIAAQAAIAVDAAASSSLPAGLPSGELRHDFGMTVEMVGSRPGKKGMRLLNEGQEVEFVVEVEKDAYVGVWVVEPDGTILQIFPNQYEQDHLLRAHVPRHLPRNQNYGINATPSVGTEFVRVIASSEKWNPLQGTPFGEGGQYAMFQSEQEKRNVSGQLRGLTVQPSAAMASQQAAENAAQVAEQIIPFEVRPAGTPARDR